jgi:hypothetical protein
MILKAINHSIKYATSFLLCILFRLLPFRPPNFEPLMTATMPFGKKWGPAAAGFFAASSMVLFDVLHPTPGFPAVGVWTLVTAATYGIIGIASGFYFRNGRNHRTAGYLSFSVAGTLVYDFITGPVMSSAIWKMPFAVSLAGQIPFTLWHLLGNILGAVFVSPLIYRWVVDNKNLEVKSISSRLGLHA